MHSKNMLVFFLKYIEVERGYSANTLRSYGDDVRQFMAFAGLDPESSDLSSITHRHIRAWISSLISQGVSPRSVNRKLSSLRSFFKFLIREGVVKNNPLSKVVAPKLSKRLPEFVPESDMAKLDPEILFSNSYEGQRDLLIVSLFYYTGMRLSELVGLTVDSVDLASDSIRVIGKGHKERLVPIHPDLKPLIGQYLEKRGEVNINSSTVFFLTVKGEPVYQKLVYRIVKHYLSMITPLQKRSPHVLRHTFATHLLNQGADINAIKELLGHANLSATQVYTHSTFEKLKRNYNQAHPRA
ncbi:MAG: tyrosine-type recombinase/integrase [Bacteroidales bacterium]